MGRKKEAKIDHHWWASYAYRAARADIGRLELEVQGLETVLESQRMNSHLLTNKINDLLGENRALKEQVAQLSQPVILNGQQIVAPWEPQPAEDCVTIAQVEANLNR